MNPIITKIGKLLINYSSEYNFTSDETLASLVTEIQETDWQQVIPLIIAEEKECEARRLERLAKCSLCGQPEKIAILEQKGECASCTQKRWDAQARLCIVCSDMYLPR